MDYYNDNDQKLCQWLQNLIKAGELPQGTIDDRSIKDVEPKQLEPYRQCHFFAGIGGWSHALSLAGWPADWPVWTGSCPCQPYSVAGKRDGDKDPRNLWPAFRRLIAECRPPIIFGEQVASKLGRQWLSGVHSDLEAVGYEVGAADLCAASIGAPHIRQRLWWVGISNGAGSQPGRPAASIARHGSTIISAGSISGLGNAKSNNEQRNPMPRENGERLQVGGSGFWSDSDLIPCKDGKARRVEPGIHPLAHGVPDRVVKLRAYGNAIVPQLAAEFIKPVIEYINRSVTKSVS